MRRAASENFSARASEEFRPMQALEAGRTALDIIAKPAAWEDAVARWGRASAAVVTASEKREKMDIS